MQKTCAHFRIYMANGLLGELSVGGTLLATGWLKMSGFSGGCCCDCCDEFSWPRASTGKFVCERSWLMVGGGGFAAWNGLLDGAAANGLPPSGRAALCGGKGIRIRSRNKFDFSKFNLNKQPKSSPEEPPALLLTSASRLTRLEFGPRKLSGVFRSPLFGSGLESEVAKQSQRNPSVSKSPEINVNPIKEERARNSL